MRTNKQQRIAYSLNEAESALRREMVYRNADETEVNNLSRYYPLFVIADEHGIAGIACEYYGSEGFAFIPQKEWDECTNKKRCIDRWRQKSWDYRWVHGKGICAQH